MPTYLLAKVNQKRGCPQKSRENGLSKSLGKEKTPYKIFTDAQVILKRKEKPPNTMKTTERIEKGRES